MWPVLRLQSSHDSSRESRRVCPLRVFYPTQTADGLQEHVEHESTNPAVVAVHLTALIFHACSQVSFITSLQVFRGHALYALTLLAFSSSVNSYRVQP